MPCSGPYSLDYYDEMYPNDIYDWSNDPNDYDFENGDNYGGNAYQGRNKTQGFHGDQHDDMNDSCQYGEMTCFEKSKVWKRYFSPLTEIALKISCKISKSDIRYFSKSIGF